MPNAKTRRLDFSTVTLFKINVLNYFSAQNINIYKNITWQKWDTLHHQTVQSSFLKPRFKRNSNSSCFQLKEPQINQREESNAHVWQLSAPFERECPSAASWTDNISFAYQILEGVHRIYGLVHGKNHIYINNSSKCGCMSSSLVVCTLSLLINQSCCGRKGQKQKYF